MQVGLIVMVDCHSNTMFSHPRWSSGYDFRLSTGRARESGVRFPVEEYLFVLEVGLIM